MEEIITKQIADELMKIEGEGRGVHFKNDAEYILKKEGPEALEKVERETERLGHPIHYKEINNTGFYPVGLRAISLLAIQQALGWSDEEIKQMCKAAVGASLIVRVFMKFLYPVLKAINIGPKMWREYWSRGSFKVAEYNKKERRMVFIVEDFDLHPVYCHACLEGFFEGMAKLTLGARKPVCKETKCSLGSDNKVHEYLLTW